MASAAICLAALAQAEGLDLRREPSPRLVPEGLLWLETPEPPDFDAKIRSVRWVRDGFDRFECEYAGAETNGTPTANLQWNRREEWGQIAESMGRIRKFKLEAIPGFTNVREPHEFELECLLRYKGAAKALQTQFVESHEHDSHDEADGHTDPHEHDHDHSHDFQSQDEHEKAHARQGQERFTNRNVTTGQLIIFGLTGGLIPCPSAFAVLLLCLQIKRFALGFALVLAFSIGLAITLVAIGSIAALSVRHATKRFSGLHTLAARMPYASATLMVLIGLFVTFEGLRTILH